jgi:uncharacterized membrane protein YkvA (DUF1232 family)
MSMMTLDEFVAAGARRLDDRQVEAFCRQELKSLTRKIARSVRPDREQFHLRVQFLVRVAGEYDDYAGRAGISEVRREAVFALRYFIEDHDAIPDTDKEYGFRDDDLVAATVLRRHAGVLAPFADACAQRWARLGL